MAYEDRPGHGFDKSERMQPSRSDRFLQRRPRQALETRERRPFGDEDFGQEREDWREPQDIHERDLFDYERGPQYGAPQWGQARQSGSSHWGTRDSNGGQSHDRPGSFVGFGPKGYRRSDERIQEDANQALSDHPELDATEIEVAVKGGEVTLRGTVFDRRAKRMAEEAIEHLPGVNDVRNEIRMSQSATNAPTHFQVPERSR